MIPPKVQGKGIEAAHKYEGEEDNQDEGIGLCETKIPIIQITSVKIEEDADMKNLETNSADEFNIKRIETKKERSVFDILNADYLSKMIPYMHPDSQRCTFRFFFDRVHEVCDGKGRTEKDILDVIQIRMGGSYLAELKDLRCKGKDLEFIKEYFIEKDDDFEKEKKRKENLVEESKEVRKKV